MNKVKVAFVCVHNSCRSQMAEALSKKLAADVFYAPQYHLLRALGYVLILPSVSAFFAMNKLDFYSRLGTDRPLADFANECQVRP